MITSTFKVISHMINIPVILPTSYILGDVKQKLKVSKDFIHTFHMKNNQLFKINEVLFLKNEDSILM